MLPSILFSQNMTAHTNADTRFWPLKSLEEKLRGSVDTRNQLFKKIFNVKSPKQEWIALRNSLSHDIESSKLVGDCISYINLKDGKEYTENIYDLFEKQINFYEELKCIVETDNEK